MPIDQEAYYKSGIFLWRSVIRRAQLEADGDYRPTSEEVETHEEIIEAARKWLATDSQDLRIVYHLGAFPRPYEEFREVMKKYAK